MSCQPLLPGLPDEIGLMCLARVPSAFHSDLCQVCKSWRSLVRSPLFLSTRSKLKVTEQFLCLTVKIYGCVYNWYVYIHHQNPKQFSYLPSLPPYSHKSTCVVLDSKVFVLGDNENQTPSPNVWVYDACYRQWEVGPPMGVARKFAAAGVIDGKIYVVGGCQINNQVQPTSWAEVFDPCLGSWSPAPSPTEIREERFHGTVVLEDKLFVMTERGGYAYDPRTSSWLYVSTELDYYWTGSSAAVIDGILYCCSYVGKIRGYDPSENRWIELQGVELPEVLGPRLANVGGNLYVVWAKMGWYRETRLECAVLEVHKDPSGGLNGLILWSDIIVSGLPKKTYVVHCMALGL